MSSKLTDLSFIMIALIFVKFQDYCKMYKNISLAVEKIAAFIEDEKVRYCQSHCCTISANGKRHHARWNKFVSFNSRRLCRCYHDSNTLNQTSYRLSTSFIDWLRVSWPVLFGSFFNSSCPNVKYIGFPRSLNNKRTGHWNQYLSR